MTLLSNPDMAYLRAEAEKLLPDTCDIQQRQQVSDGLGGFTLAWAVVYEDVPCRLSEGTGKENMAGSRESGDSSWVLTLPYDQALAREDRVSHGGHSYEVVFVNTDRSHDSVRRAELRRLT